MSRTRLIVLFLVAVAAVGVAAWLLAGGPGGSAGATPAPSLGPVPESTTVTADARAVPLTRVELAAPAGGGVVAEVVVAEGDAVTAGQVLLRLDGSRLEAEVAMAEAGVAVAQAGVAQAGQSVRQAEAQLTAADAAVDQADAVVRAADATRDATPSGTNARRAADAEVDRARAALRGARAQATSAGRARDAARAAVAVAEAEVARATAVLASAQAALDDLVLTAPIPGTVASLDAVVGETVAPGAPVVRIAGSDGWRFETIDLDEASVGRIAEGAAAMVSVDAFADLEIPAHVVSIDRFGEASAGDIVYAVVLEPTGDVPAGLRWNMTASARIETGE